jgi:hypothetical protein
MEPRNDSIRLSFLGIFYFLFRVAVHDPTGSRQSVAFCFVFSRSTQQFANMISATTDEPLHGKFPDLHS